MNADWRIAPHHGIGRLAFGLSPDEVASMATLYGKPSPLMPGAASASEVEELIAQLGESMPEEAIAILRQTARELENFERQNLTKGSSSVLLEYRDGKLDGVTVEAAHAEAHFEGERIFALGGQDVLSLFERANGAPGRYNSTEAAFDNIAASLFCFSILSPTGEVRVLPDGNADFKRRSVTLRREPYRPAHEQDQFVTFSFN